jgi:predicted dehydrogenase
MWHHQQREVPMSATAPNRREFLQTIEQLGIGALVLGTGLETARGYGANDTIEIGAIGTGGRCRRLMQTLKELPNVRLSAVCDIFDGHVESAQKIADPAAFATKRYAELLERGDLDAVVIGSPDHWHVPMTIDSVRAGKDVYVEKPLTHHPSEGAAVIDAVGASDRIVQVGMQQRSMPQLQKAREIFQSGRLGVVHKVHLTWNRNTGSRFERRSLNIDPNQVNWQAFLGSAPDQPYDEYKFRNWRWFWDFGGGILTDLMVHFIDVAHWFFESSVPATAMAMGHNYSSEGIWQTPDTVHCLLDYPDKQYQAYFEGTFSNARNRAMLEFMGSEATLYMDRGRYEIHPENSKSKYEEWVPGKEQRRGLDFYLEPNGELIHLADWIDSVRTRRPPSCPVEEGVKAAAAAHLGNRALREGIVARAQG